MTYKNLKQIVLIYFAFACGCSAQYEKTGLEGKPLPSFNLLLTDSVNQFNTNNIARGHVSVFFYFGPNCPYSRAQMREITENMKTLKNINFYVFTSSPFAEMKEFVTHYQLEKFKNIITGFDYEYFATKYFDIKTVPFIAIYNKDNKMTAAFRTIVPVDMIFQFSKN